MMNYSPGSAQQQDDVKQYLREFHQIYGLRGVWEQHWQEIAMVCLPGHINTFNALSIRTPGQKRMQNVFDSTAIIALERFAAVMNSILTPSSKMWMELKAGDPTLDKDRECRLWLEYATRRVFELMYDAQAGFESQLDQLYLSIGAYGTGSLFTDERGGDPGVRFRCSHLGETYIRENHQGIVDAVYRYFMLSAYQAYSKWPETLPGPLRQMAKDAPDTMGYYLHVVRPRQDWDRKRLDYKRLPWASCYIAMQGEAFLEEGGYNVFPYSVSRYKQYPGEVYGRSPAMDALPAIKMLNQEKYAVIRQLHRIVDPVLLTHDDGVISGFNMKPGAINSGAVSADGKPLIHALPTGDIRIGTEQREEERNLIKSTFLTDLFQILVESPEMTATEVLEREHQRGMFINPKFARFQGEVLAPVVHRVLEIALRKRWIAPPPPKLAQFGNYAIKYTAPLNRDQQADEAAGLQRSLQNTVEIATQTQRPDLMDYYNFDVIIPEMSAIGGTPARWMNSEQAVAAVRKARDQQAQVQQAIQAAPGAAAMMKAGAVVQQTQGGGGPNTLKGPKA